MTTVNERVTELCFGMDMDFKLQAELSGVPVFTLRNIRYGRTTHPKSDTIMALARFYDVSVDYLLGVSDVKRRFGE